MIKVGITGGIGSGKSIICQVFIRLGVPVYYADDAAKKLMEQDPDIRKALVSLLGENIYAGNSLDRPKMTGLIFNDPGLLLKVNRIVHPRVVDDFMKWCVLFEQLPYVIHESAILFENELHRLFDFIILVTAPEEVRFQRALQRKSMTAEKIKSIMKNQLQEKENIVRSHLVLNNDGKNLLLPEILNIHAKLTRSDQ